jgi:molybdopterin-guanine dinucleotide biosynthesis protein
VIIAVGGLTSEVGKTTLMCQLLKEFPGWEAIKTTRGHYRSCGKDANTCCVSHLLEEQPVVRSGKDLTYAPGKDTGRYWDSGAANVHWVIATDEQVSDGVKQAISRVQAKGVFIEGNSFTEFEAPDFFVMVTRSDSMKIKTTARKALPRASAFYISDDRDLTAGKNLGGLMAQAKLQGSNLRVFSSTNFQGLISAVREVVQRSQRGAEQTQLACHAS